MAIPRKDQIDTESGGYYHLISRCVRCAFLCGDDPKTRRSFEHRRKWIENRILELAEVFAIEVYAYAVMHNHYLCGASHNIIIWWFTLIRKRHKAGQIWR